jgi:hypothetical protein
MKDGKSADFPLHVGLRVGVAPSVVLAVVRAWPAACKIVGADGNYPLHYATWDAVWPTIVVAVLFQAYPLAAYERDHFGKLPAEWLGGDPAMLGGCGGRRLEGVESQSERDRDADVLDGDIGVWTKRVGELVQLWTPPSQHVELPKASTVVTKLFMMPFFVTSPPFPMPTMGSDENVKTHYGSCIGGDCWSASVICDARLALLASVAGTKLLDAAAAELALSSTKTMTAAKVCIMLRSKLDEIVSSHQHGGGGSVDGDCGGLGCSSKLAGTIPAAMASGITSARDDASTVTMAEADAEPTLPPAVAGTAALVFSDRLTPLKMILNRHFQLTLHHLPAGALTSPEYDLDLFTRTYLEPAAEVLRANILALMGECRSAPAKYRRVLKSLSSSDRTIYHTAFQTNAQSSSELADAYDDMLTACDRTLTGTVAQARGRLVIRDRFLTFTRFACGSGDKFDKMTSLRPVSLPIDLPLQARSSIVAAPLSSEPFVWRTSCWTSTDHLMWVF